MRVFAGRSISVDWAVESKRLDQNPRLAGLHGYRDEIDEKAKTLKLWVRRKRGNRRLTSSGSGRRVTDRADITEREVRDLPCFQYRTTVVIELYRVRCPDCGLKIEGSIWSAVARRCVNQNAYVGVAVKPVGKPDALVGHVRVDERGRETTG